MTELQADGVRLEPPAARSMRRRARKATAPQTSSRQTETRVEHSPMSPFGSIRASDVRSLGGPVLDVEVEAGTEIVRQDEIVGTFFVIRSGTALLLRDGTPVATLGADNCFGEIDPLAHAPQAYSVVAATQLKLLAFSSYGIARLCDALPGVRERLVQTLAPPSPTRSRSAAASSTVIVR
jgi:Cyclic nucleotide-binding domain